jgi:hypothetical protein
MDIKKVIEEHNKASQRVSELSYQIGEHYRPIINKLTKAKDKKGLEALLCELPECMTKLGVYQALREIKDK